MYQTLVEAKFWEHRDEHMTSSQSSISIEGYRNINRELNEISTDNRLE